MSARRASRSAALGALCGASLALASWACADRADAAAAALDALVYTTAPLAGATEITGSPSTIGT